MRVLFVLAGRFLSVAPALISLALLTGCATHLSEGLQDNGEVREVVFPPTSSATRPEGTFPDREVLYELKPGVRKSHLLQWFGPPHFSEGIVGVREWDYIFHFYSGGGITTCRYKILFDTAYVARGLHWRPSECGQWLSASPARQAGAGSPH